MQIRRLERATLTSPKSKLSLPLAVLSLGFAMWIVRLALRRPYTFVVMAVLIAILGTAAIISMPVDIFPYIDIPVVSVVWNYGGLAPEEMEKRMVTVFERALTTTVNDIEHLETQ